MPACGTAEAQSDTLCETQPGCHGLTSRGHFWTFWLPGQVSNLGNYNDLWKNSPSISVGHHSLVLLLAKCGLCRGHTVLLLVATTIFQETLWSAKQATSDWQAKMSNNLAFCDDSNSGDCLSCCVFPCLTTSFPDLINFFHHLGPTHAFYLVHHPEHSECWHSVRPSLCQHCAWLFET